MVEKTSCQRLDYVDTAKAVAITLVVIVHTQLPELIQKWIVVFLIPLFFFTAGYLFSFGRNPAFGLFVSKRSRQIAVPYVAVNILTYLFWVIVVRRYSIGHDYSSVPLLKPIVAAFLGDATAMIHCTAMWFVGCLFVVEMMYFMLFRKASRKMRFLLMAAVFGVGWANSVINADRLPFFAGQALMGLVFYAAGSEARRSALAFSNSAVAALSLCITVLAAWSNGKVEWYANSYGSMVWYVAGSVAGIYMVFYACRRADGFLSGVRGAVRFVSVEILLICGFHLAVMSCLKGVLSAVCGYDVRLLCGAVWQNFLLAFACLATCCAGIYAYRLLLRR